MDKRTDLDKKVRFYKSLAYAPNTCKAYRVHRRKYLRFCNSIGVYPVPATSETLCRYAAYLANSLKFSSIKQYMNIVRLLHQEWGLPNPLETDFHLKNTLRGIRRHLGDRVIRKSPISPELLVTFLNTLDVRSPRGASIWAAALLMWFGLLRRSNVMPNSQGDFDADKHLRRKDLSFTSEGLKVRIRWSKTNQFRSREMLLPYPRLKGQSLCPTQAVYNAVRLTPGAPMEGPALTLTNSPPFSPLTPAIFIDALRRALGGCGRDPRDFSGHSFRRGGAVWGYRQGLSVDTLRELGDWRSNSYTAYILLGQDGLTKATRVMGQGLP